MDARHFDTLTRMLTTPHPRRLLGLLATLPLLGGLLGLLGWLDPEDSTAKDRRRRRKGRHKQKQGKAKGKRQRQQRKRACKPKGKAAVCAGTCGEVKSRQTCGKTVDCGACDCPTPCGACFTCQSGPNTPGACVPDPDQAGDPCGAAGQVCAADGSCACTETSCPACEECGGDGVCTGCSGCCDGQTCVAACPSCTLCAQGQCLPCPGCCDGSGICQDGNTDAACGQSGGECDICTAPETCGGGQDAGVCGCTPTTCEDEDKNCGQINDGCGVMLDCGSCSGDTPICISNVCTACSTNQQCGDGSVCCSGACFSGICCGDTDCDDAAAPDCKQHSCTCVSNGDVPCSGGKACCAGGCVNLKADPVNCGACGNDCPANHRCVDGACTACTVTCEASDHICDGAALQTALAAGGTVVVCPGLYTGAISVANLTALTIIGAGDGDDPATNTTLRDLSVSSVTTFTMSHVRVRGFADQAGCDAPHGISISDSSATLTDCTIARIGPKFCNTRSSFVSSTVEMVRCLVTGSYRYGYGGLQVAGGKLTVRGSTFSQNYTLGDGGGLMVISGGVVKLLDGTTVADNRADGDGGGIYADAGVTVTISTDSSVTGNRDHRENPSNCEGGGTFDGTCGP